MQYSTTTIHLLELRGLTSHPACAPVRQTLSEISLPVELDPRRVAERLASGNLPPIHSLLRRVAEIAEGLNCRDTPYKLAKLLRQARGKV